MRAECSLVAGMTLTAPAARADVVNFALSSTTFYGYPGETVDFVGTISAPGTNNGYIDLLGLNIKFVDDMGGPWLAVIDIDPTAFCSLPEFLNPGDSLTNVLLFTAKVDPTVKAPVSGVVSAGLVALDKLANDVSTTAVAGVDVGVVPEPSSLLMLGTGLIGFAGMIRRKQRPSDLEHTLRSPARDVSRATDHAIGFDIPVGGVVNRSTLSTELAPRHGFEPRETEPSLSP